MRACINTKFPSIPTTPAPTNLCTILLVLFHFGSDEAAEVLGTEVYRPGAAPLPKDRIPCYDPSTMQLLGYAKAMTPAEVSL